MPDRLRLNSDQEQNLRINVDTGATTNDGALAYAPADRNAGANPDVAGAAYTNADTDPATGTMLFDIDAAQDVLAIQNPPNDGVLITVGGLGVDTTKFVGFDITPPSAGATPYAVLDPKGHGSRLYVIDLATGKARQVGQVGNASPYRLNSLATLGARAGTARLTEAVRWSSHAPASRRRARARRERGAARRRRRPRELRGPSAPRADEAPAARVPAAGAALGRRDPRGRRAATRRAASSSSATARSSAAA